MKALAGTTQAEGEAARQGEADDNGQNMPSPPAQSGGAAESGTGLNVSRDLLLRHEQIAQRVKRRR